MIIGIGCGMSGVVVWMVKVNLGLFNVFVVVVVVVLLW